MDNINEDEDLGIDGLEEFQFFEEEEEEKESKTKEESIVEQ